MMIVVLGDEILHAELLNDEQPEFTALDQALLHGKFLNAIAYILLPPDSSFTLSEGGCVLVEEGSQKHPRGMGKHSGLRPR